MRAEVEQRVVAALHRSPRLAAVVQLHPHVELAARRNLALEREPLVEAAVEGDPRRRRQRGEPQRAGGIGRGGLLDERRQPPFGGRRGGLLVKLGRRADDDAVKRGGGEQLAETSVAGAPSFDATMPRRSRSGSATATISTRSRRATRACSRARRDVRSRRDRGAAARRSCPPCSASPQHDARGHGRRGREVVDQVQRHAAERQARAAEPRTSSA